MRIEGRPSVLSGEVEPAAHLELCGSSGFDKSCVEKRRGSVDDSSFSFWAIAGLLLLLLFDKVAVGGGRRKSAENLEEQEKQNHQYFI